MGLVEAVRARALALYYLEIQSPVRSRYSSLFHRGAFLSLVRVFDNDGRHELLQSLSAIPLTPF